MPRVRQSSITQHNSLILPGHEPRVKCCWKVSRETLGDARVGQTSRLYMGLLAGIPVRLGYRSLHTVACRSTW